MPRTKFAKFSLPHDIGELRRNTSGCASPSCMLMRRSWPRDEKSVSLRQVGMTLSDIARFTSSLDTLSGLAPCHVTSKTSSIRILSAAMAGETGTHKRNTTNRVNRRFGRFMALIYSSLRFECFLNFSPHLQAKLCRKNQGENLLIAQY